jgi:hypothetical protein
MGYTKKNWMKRIVIFALMFVNFFTSYGQKQHLEPENFNVGGGLEIYYKNLNTLLFNRLSDKPYARYVVIPSFSKEYAFSIEKKNKKFFVISISLSESYWRAKDKNAVKFTIEKHTIEKELFKKIGDLFQLLANQTKSYELINYSTDGEKYYFMSTNNKGDVQIGSTWSPSDNSMMGRLIKVSNKLYSIGSGNDISKTEISNEIDELITELKK